MFFILSKTAFLFLMPSNLLFTVGLLGLVLMSTRFKLTGKHLALASLILLTVSGFSNLGVALSQVLESRFPPWNPAQGAPDGIVVLGGAIDARLSRDYGDTVINGEADRVMAIAKLARAYPTARIVYSGGNADLFKELLPEANFLYPLLDSFGIPRARVMLEARSRNTEENAVFSKALVQPKPGQRWLLVTSAQHMPRAIGCFRQIGFPVEAYPVAWHIPKRVDLGGPKLLSSGLTEFDYAAREWIGLLAYWLTGRTSELLPGPVLADGV